MKEDKLHNVNSTGFKAPEDYFESFDDKLMQRIAKENVIESIESPGFKTPEGYFDTLEDKILKGLISENDMPVVSIFRRKQFYYISGLAASLLLLFAIFINQPTSEELSVEMVEDYFINSDLDSYELAELLSDADILEDDFTITEIKNTEENLELYLLENADIEAILE